MDKDIVSELLESIQNDFDTQTFNSPKLKSALALLKSKQATYIDVNSFAIEVGEILAQVLGNHITVDILPDGKMYFNIAERLLNTTMQKNQELIANFAGDVQTELNHQAGLKLKGQTPMLNQDRIDGIVNRLADAEDFDSVKWLLDDPMINFSQSIVDDAIRINAEFHSKAGLQPKITRRVDGRACDWCKNLAGTYDYYSEPDDMYRRHERCRCTVEYDPKDSRGIQDSHTKVWQDPQKNAKIEARKQIGNTKKELLEKVYLHSRLDVVDPISNEKYFIPKSTIIQSPKTIAQGSEIRVVGKLVDEFGGRLPNWKKRVGRIESEKYMHDVHWYENKGKQYQAKVKFRRRRNK